MSGKIDYFSQNASNMQIVICNICQKYFNGKIPYQDHLESKAHKRKEQEKILLQTMSEIKLEQSLLQDTVENDTFIGKYRMMNNDFENNDLSKQSALLVTHKKHNNCNDMVTPLTTIKVDSSNMYCDISNETKKCEMCVVCQKFFRTPESVALHFNSKEHKIKTENQRQIDMLYRQYKEQDIQNMVASLLSEKLPESVNHIKEIDKSVSGSTCTNNVPLYMQSEMTYLSKPTYKKESSTCGFYSKSSQERIKPIEPLFTSVNSKNMYLETAHCSSRFNEPKKYPGCDICGISSFMTMEASLNHNLTVEHCRKFALYNKTQDMNILEKKHYSLINFTDNQMKQATDVENQQLFSKTNILNSKSKIEDKMPFSTTSHVNSASLNPIGYEWKLKCKQTKEQNISSDIMTDIILPDSYNVDYEASSHLQQLQISSKEISISNQFAQNIHSINPSSVESNVNSKMQSIEPGSSLFIENIRKRPSSRIAAQLTNDSHDISNKNLLDVTIIGPNEKFHF